MCWQSIVNSDSVSKLGDPTTLGRCQDIEEKCGLVQELESPQLKVDFNYSYMSIKCLNLVWVSSCLGINVLQCD